MPEIFEYDPTKGVMVRWDYDQMTGEAYLNRKQDLRGWKDMTAEARNTGRMEKGVFDGGREFECAYSIPNEVEVELLKKGINIHSKDPQMIKRMFQELDANYPYTKMNGKKYG